MSFPFVQPYFGLGNSLQTAQAAAGGGAGVGGWVELGRTTLGSTTEPITVSSLSDKRYYMILSNVLPNSGRAATTRRLGSGTVDTGSNYASRRSDNGASDATNTSRTHTDNVNINTDDTQQFCIDYCSNLAAKEKLGQTQMVLQNDAGAANAPSRAESIWKWTNTSNPLDIYEIKREPSESVNWLSGSECVVLGWDPADTHTSNFWEELASVSGTSVTSLSTGTFTAKKYLWVQAHFTGGGNAEIQVGNGTIDTGSNYAWRNNTNGGSDAALASHSKLFSFSSNSATAGGAFLNCFMINNASNEKLAIAHTIEAETAGAGTAPNRGEKVGKWANTSNQINIIKMKDDNEADAYDTCLIKVWGSD